MQNVTKIMHRFHLLTIESCQNVKREMRGNHINAAASPISKKLEKWRLFFVMHLPCTTFAPYIFKR